MEAEPPRPRPLVPVLVLMQGRLRHVVGLIEPVRDRPEADPELHAQHLMRTRVEVVADAGAEYPVREMETVFRRLAAVGNRATRLRRRIAVRLTPRMRLDRLVDG